MISVVVPHYYGLEGVDKALRHCLKSLVGYDEIIVLANDGIGYGAACNLGMASATGDYIVLSNNDCALQHGSLKDLTNNGCITVPKIVPPARDILPRPFFCVPRWIYEQVVETYGYFYDERFEGGYWEDDDLHRRLDEMGIETKYVESVVVNHLHGGGMTMKQIGEQEHYDKNLEIYNDKWGLNLS